MRISITFAILLLSLSIMSYGLTGAVSAQSNVPPISVATDFPAYGETGLIGISGHVKESIISEFPMPVIIKVQKEDGSLVAIAQVDVDRDGDFSTSVTPGGQMSTAGEYTVTAIYNKNEAQSIFTYSGGSGGSGGISRRTHSDTVSVRACACVRGWFWFTAESLRLLL